MNFPMVMYSPYFALAGVAAIALAAWMHLYQRSARRRQPISSLRLVPETQRVARNRKRIQHWPLFLLRAFGVLLLGLAFSRPGLPGGGGDPSMGRETVAFVLDRSGSMHFRSEDGRSAWEEAIQHIQNRLSRLHPQSRARVLCFPPAEGLEEDWSSPQAVIQQLNDLEPSFEQGRPLSALQAAAEALARFRGDMPETLEIVGDLHPNGWDEMDTLSLPGELQVRVHQVGDSESANHGLALQTRGQGPLRRGAVIHRGGEAALLLHDQPQGGEDLPETNIPATGEVAEIPYKTEQPGWVRRKVTLSQASDGLEEDNTLFDAFFVAPEIPVYLIEPHMERENFLQATFFLQQALRPTTGEGAADSQFLPRTLPLDGAANTLNHLDIQQAVVVIPAMANWPKDLLPAIEAFRQKGNGVIFFAGPQIQPNAYTDAWKSLLPAFPQDILPPIGPQTLQYFPGTHPLWGSFQDSARRNLRKAPLKERFSLSLAEGAQVLANYSDGVPLVVSHGEADSGVLFINTSIDRAWSDWPTGGALFVPAMHRLMRQVVSPVPHELRNSLGAGIVGVQFDVQVDPVFSGITLQINGQTVVPEKGGWCRNLLFDHPGLFNIQTEDGQTVRPVAANFPPEESLRDSLAPTILERQLIARRRVEQADEETARISISYESGWWRWLLGALAIVWLIEPWMALRTPRTNTP